MLDTASGLRVYLDGWFKTNPFCPEELKVPERADAFVVTHGHRDHLDHDLHQLLVESGATLVAPAAVRMALEAKGPIKSEGVNFGGTTTIGALSLTMMLAFHASHVASDEDPGAWPHQPCGYILREDGMPTTYIAGDTGPFADMELIGKMYRPQVAILPIGGKFTMGPYEAAWAAKLLGAETIIPCHYNSFPMIKGTAEEFRSHLESPLKVVELKPGETFEF